MFPSRVELKGVTRLTEKAGKPGKSVEGGRKVLYSLGWKVIITQFGVLRL